MTAGIGGTRGGVEDPRYPRVDGGSVRRLRLAQGWTQEELAHRSGLAVRTVRNAEAGRRVSVSTVGILAATFGCDVAALLGRGPGPWPTGQA
ncbi:MAG: XRE family transcriptional regulator [Deltaproteobacteria bacterium]|nr:MAG: XRE family transcriptional regulator [Deltaproteobacteria bacterium]